MSDDQTQGASECDYLCSQNNEILEIKCQLGKSSKVRYCQVPQIDIASKGTSLVVQGLRLWAPNTGGLGSILGQRTRSHVCLCVCVLIAQSCRLFATTQNIDHQAPLSMEFSRQVLK